MDVWLLASGLFVRAYSLEEYTLIHHRILIVLPKHLAFDGTFRFDPLCVAVFRVQLLLYHYQHSLALMCVW